MGLGAQRRTALVTGAAGFIGSHLVDRLLADGFEVIGLDNLMTGDLTNLELAKRDPHFHFVLGDVRERLAVYAELIFNFACPASPVHYQDDRWATTTTSALGAIRLVEYARLHRCRIVHASTSEVYGDPEVHPQREDYWGHVNPIGERACYDEGKRVAETLLFDAIRSFGADARVVRIFNTYGPRMALNDGRVVSNFLLQILEGRPLTIYGEGKQTRSFCFVSDLVNGIVAASAVKSLDGPVNLGNPRESTMLELAEVAMKVAGRTVDLTRKPLPPDDPRQRCPDIAKARSVLGFEPKVPLEVGLKATLEDFRARLGPRPT
ncbi:MAG: UDP-glucuronic acid decarboxylase family protein [Candidatus Lutacidiplasmatales archaeon]